MTICITYWLLMRNLKLFLTQIGEKLMFYFSNFLPNFPPIMLIAEINKRVARITQLLHRRRFDPWQLNRLRQID